MLVVRNGEAAGLPVPQSALEAHFEAAGLSGAVTAEFELYVRAAAVEIEGLAGIALLDQTVTITLDKWPSAEQKDTWREGVFEIPDTALVEFQHIPLPIGPVVDFDSAVITAVDEDGGEVEIPASELILTAGRFAKVQPKAASPTLRDHRQERLRIEYTAGYGEDEGVIPSDLRLAVMDHALRLYERRGDEGEAPLDLSPVARRIVNRYREIRA